EGSIASLEEELSDYGDRVMLVYGKGSIKTNGIYDEVVGILRRCGKTVFEDPGVMPNPTMDKLREGMRIASSNRVDLILAVGGGSVCDYAKAVSVSAYCTDDPWERYFIRGEDPECGIIPVGCVLTMVGTGSEMNAGAVITNTDTRQKISRNFKSDVMPRFSILDPTYTFTLPRKQMAAGIYDAFNHLCEQYFSGDDDCTSDYISEGLMRSLIHSSYDAVRDPTEYQARSNIMWTATWALNTLVSRGKSTDWEVHMIGKSIGAYTDATHGLTLSAVSMAYYRMVMPYGLHRFVRFAENVWDVDPKGMTEEEIASEGLESMHRWMHFLGVDVGLRELGVTDDMVDDIADGTILRKGGYHPLTREEVVSILESSM
ncbi:MAG: iron-containing alcohol dehydrogenase, partial [Candidatus Methanomethylophilaceae archaeon]|nr:iron-containing alcohol dehydrogenase [Candidatus Methanomethylophilaceae archaeon]